MTVDAADPDAAPTLTDGNNTLTLRFDTPKGAGDVVFAVIAPVELTAEQPVTITAICEAGESEPRDILGKHFSEGHTTPIAYHIPTIGRYYTRLNFSLPADKGMATLGEAVGKITLTAPARCSTTARTSASSRPTPKANTRWCSNLDRQPLGKSRHGTVRIGKRCRIKHADDAADHRIRQQRHHVQRPLPAGGGFQQYHPVRLRLQRRNGNKQQQRRKQGCAPAVRQGRHRMDGGSVWAGKPGNVSEAPAGSKAEEPARLHRMPATRDVSTRRPSAVSNPAKQSESGFHSITSEDRTPG